MNLSSAYNGLLSTLEKRFNANLARHEMIDWADVQAQLMKHQDKLQSLLLMEESGGEPDVIDVEKSGTIIFCDCSPESPPGRRSLCYDLEALDSRKEHKPSGSAMEVAHKMGIELLNEEHYRKLQEKGPFDLKTSSWIVTPPEIRKLGGALFGDHRYGQTFIYHNGAQSYYAARGFRGILKI